MKPMLLAGVAAIAAIAAPASAVIVYNTAPGLAGNQAYSGTIGLDFRVNTAVRVTALGAFDALSDGLSTDIFVGIFNAAGVLVSPVINFNGATNDGSSAYVFQSITPIVLAAGDYQVGAWGYNGVDLNYNNSGPGGPITFNSFSGKLTALGTRYAGSGGVIGNIPDVGLTRYGGATLNVTSVPEPASWALLLAGFGMIGYSMRRRGMAVVSA